MQELIEIIDAIVKYGINPNVDLEDKEIDLEKNLVKVYSKCFDVKYEPDDKDYEGWNKRKLFPDVVENVQSNFRDFGWYHVILNSTKILEEPATGTGDAIDDLSDIIYDLLEVKWRRDNNSENDAWSFFEMIFHGHTQQHLLDLLSYLKNKRD